MSVQRGDAKASRSGPARAASGRLPAMEMPPAPARSFASDNSAGVHPAVLDALQRCNTGHALAYGADDHTAECSARFSRSVRRRCPRRTHLQRHRERTSLRSQPCSGRCRVRITRSSAPTGPTSKADETGAPERILATKLIDLPCPEAKLVPEQLAELAHLQGVQHHVQPGVVSITQATELGTLYSADEIAALCDQAHRWGCWCTSTAPGSPMPPPPSAARRRRCGRSRSTPASMRSRSVAPRTG